MFANFSYNVSPNADDPNGGGGGGGGGGASSNMPIGVVVPFAGSTIPANWLLCDGTEYRPDADYKDLFNVIGFSYGANPASTQITAGSYVFTIDSNQITIQQNSQTNTFVYAGSYVKLSGFTASTGPDINGAIVYINSAPPINTSGTGFYFGTFVQPIAGLGTGVAGGILNRFSIPLPDLRLSTPVGAQAGTIALGSFGGSATTTINVDNLPEHKHGVLGAAGEGFTSFSSNGVGYGASGSIASTLGSQTKTDATVYSTSNVLATNSAISTRNPYVGMNYIIHAKN